MYNPPNFDRTKISKTHFTYNIKIMKILLAICTIIILCIILFAFNKFSSNSFISNPSLKSNYKEIISTENIAEYLICDNKMWEFISNGKIYYMFDILQEEERKTIYLSQDQVKIKETITDNSTIVVNKIKERYFIFDKIYKKYKEDIKENNTYTICLSQNISIENLGDINLNKNTQTITFFPFFMPRV